MKNFIEAKLKDIVVETCLGGNYQCCDEITELPVIKMGNIGRGRIALNKIAYVANKKILSNRDILKDKDILLRITSQMFS